VETDESPAALAQRVTPLELFFDLVFVFALFQVTTFLSHHATSGGLLRAVMLLSALWWLWSGYAWLTNTLDPEEGAVRLAVFAAIAGTLLVALATPDAFGSEALLFAIAYSAVRGLHVILLAVGARGRPYFLRTVGRIAVGGALTSALLIAASLTPDSTQLALWFAALAVVYVGPIVIGLGGFSISPDHFVERYSLVIIIALGEAIVEIGVGAAGLDLDASVLTAALLGLAVAACIWWSYFDWSMYVAQARLGEATGGERSALARDLYAYLHLPMVAGIVLFAFGLKTVVSHGGDDLGWVPALGLCGGIALYLLAHVALRLRIGGGWGRGRPVAMVLSVALVPTATCLPGLVTLSLLTAVCIGLIAYEFFSHRDSRAFIRNRRGAFTGHDVEEFNARGRAERAPNPSASSTPRPTPGGE